MVAGIVFFAFGLEMTLHQLDHSLATVPAVALCAGCGVHLLAHVASLLRATGHLCRPVAPVFEVARVPSRARRRPSVGASQVPGRVGGPMRIAGR